MTVRHEAFKRKLASEASAKEEAAQRKLQMQKIAKATAKRMITRRSEQASNKARREEGSAKRERRVRRTRRNERQAGLTTAEIRAKREKKGIGKSANQNKQAEKKSKGNGVATLALKATDATNKTDRKKRPKSEVKARRMRKGIGKYAK